MRRTERIQLENDRGLTPLPLSVEVGADLADVSGVVSYSFGNFEVLLTGATIAPRSPLVREITPLTGTEDELTLASYNVLNVSAGANDAAQIARLGAQIATGLGAPDIVALREIQDDNGSAEESGSFVDANGDGSNDEADGDVLIDDGVLSADATLQALADAVVDAGGPAYDFVSAAVDEFDENGGVPGGNIRNAFLYNPKRVVLEKATTLESDLLQVLGAANPDAFDGTRDPLLGRFTFRGETLFVLNNQFSSRIGSEPIFGAKQPFFQAGEEERQQQVLAVNAVVDAILAADEDADVAVVADLNTFEFADEIAEDLAGRFGGEVLTNLVNDVDEGERYTFIFDGNSEVLDHILVSDALADDAEIDIVHLNVDFVDGVSDHEPLVARLAIGGPVRMVGTPGNDTLAADSGRGDVAGGAGDDVIAGSDGDDTLSGGVGDDQTRATAVATASRPARASTPSSGRPATTRWPAAVATTCCSPARATTSSSVATAPTRCAGRVGTTVASEATALTPCAAEPATTRCGGRGRPTSSSAAGATACCSAAIGTTRSTAARGTTG